MINLKAALIGDPFVSPVRQRMATHLIAEGSGILDSTQMRQIAAIRRECEKVIATDWVNVDEPCTAILQYVQSVSGRVVNYDATIFNYDLDAIQSPYNAYLMDFIDGKVSNAKA